MKLSYILDTKSKNILLAVKYFLFNNNQIITAQDLFSEIVDELKPKGTSRTPTLVGFLHEFSVDSNRKHNKNNPKGYIFFNRTATIPYKYSLTDELYEKLMNTDIDEIKIRKPKKVLKIETNNNSNLKEEEMKLSQIIGSESQFITLPIEFLLQNKNEPSTCSKIYENIKAKLSTNGATPESTLNAVLGKYVQGTTHKKSKGSDYFFMRDSNKRPYEYYIVPELYEKLKNSEIDDVENFYKSVKIDKEEIEEIEEFEQIEIYKELVVKNPLNQAICILGDSGNGKTYTTKKTLKNENHKILYQILDESQDHILYEYIPYEQKYEITKIGEFILNANANPQILFTIIFDECHKYLDKVNDTLLQCLSLERNGGERFLPLNRKVNELFNELEDSEFGKKIPDNLGFIFISSKPRNIDANEDFKNRLKFYKLDKDFENNNFTINYLKNIEYEFD